MGKQRAGIRSSALSRVTADISVAAKWFGERQVLYQLLQSPVGLMTEVGSVVIVGKLQLKKLIRLSHS
jgi:hypothetical protein